MEESVVMVGDRMVTVREYDSPVPGVRPLIWNKLDSPRLYSRIVYYEAVWLDVFFYDEGLLRVELTREVGGVFGYLVGTGDWKSFKKRCQAKDGIDWAGEGF